MRGELPIRKSRKAGTPDWSAPGFLPRGGISRSLRRVRPAICSAEKKTGSLPAIASATAVWGNGVLGLRPRVQGTGAGGGGAGLAVCWAPSRGASPSATIARTKSRRCISGLHLACHPSRRESFLNDDSGTARRGRDSFVWTRSCVCQIEACLALESCADDAGEIDPGR